MKDQMLEDKYNELGKAHAGAMNQLAKKDEIIKELKKLSDEAKEILQQEYCAISLQEWIDSHHEVKKKIEELENE